MAQQTRGPQVTGGEPVVVTSPWRSLVLSYGAEGEAPESDSSKALERDRAFAHHMRRMFQRPTLDVDIVNHCNLNCACCCHYSPIADPGFLAPEDLEQDLALLAQIEGVEEFFDAICLMGGEPLLHPQLPEIAWLVRRYLPSAIIRLVTNGILLGDASAELWEALHEVGAQILITPYPTGIDYVGLVELATSHGIDAVLGGGLAVSDEGEAFFLKNPLDERGEQDPAESFIACPLAGSTMQLLDHRIYPCNGGALLGRLNERFGTAFRHEPDDYLELASIRNADEIETFRRTKKPMCRYCAHGLVERIAWGPSSRSASEWLVGCS